MSISSSACRARAGAAGPARKALLCTLAVVMSGLIVASDATAATVGWAITAVTEPTQVSVNDAVRCEAPEARCDQYQILIRNSGDAASAGTVTLTDTLPSGITTRRTPISGTANGLEWTCTEGAGNAVVTCTVEGAIPAGGYAPPLEIVVSAPTEAMSGVTRNEVAVTGGGAASPSLSVNEAKIATQPPAFGLDEFNVAAAGVGGAPSAVAGAHPWQVTTNVGFPAIFSPPGVESADFVPVENAKDVVTDLPPGLVGNVTHIPQCSQTQLRQEACPSGSRIGAFAIRGGLLAGGAFAPTGNGCCSAVYNITPERGYPAEFGFTFATIPVYIYATLAHSSSGYHLRVNSSGIPSQIEIIGVALTFYGDPGQVNEEGDRTPLVTNPTDCRAGRLGATSETSSWEDPGLVGTKTAILYEAIEGCSSLHYEPSIGIAPREPTEGTTQADTPSGYEVNLTVPEHEGANEQATPPTKRLTLTFPVGVALSPAAASGLVGCQRSGPEGVDLPEGDHGATETGEGEMIGSDGFSHLAAGHCPAASDIGEIQVETPILPPRTLKGRVFIGAPLCGGTGQPECDEASATNGELYHVYAEIAGAGVVVKLPGSVAANPATGQLTVTFDELPQFPVSHVMVRLEGGPHAPLANPQSCGRASATADLTPWSTPETPDATPTANFEVTGCLQGMPFGPLFSSGTVAAQAGGFSPLVFTVSRSDREERLGGITVNMPPGLLADLATVPLCNEPQAQRGTCPATTKIGTTVVAAGAGTQPLGLTGSVYLTGPYKRAPFGLSVVVPAKAGPFNLGDEVVRAAITVDRNTAAVTITSDPLPQILDGVPFRLKTINVTIDRPSFVFNPTNCSQRQISGAISGVLPDGSPGSTVAVASLFAAAGCKNLPFKPKFTVLTQAKTSKANGASLHVKVTSGPGQANIGKVKVDLPKQLPSRLTTLQKACPDATFNANPASCPPGSVVGTATAVTPVLKDPLTGPAYLVSHAGAAFPDLVIVLQGEGITLDLVGNTDIKHGITISTFNSVPDAPISTFDLMLPEGPHSALGAFGNLCKSRLNMPTALTGQNGAVIKQTTRLAVAGCKAVTISNRKLSGKNVVLSFLLTAKGTVTVTGNGLKRFRKTLGAGSHEITVALSKAGLSMRRHHRKIKIKVALRSGATRSSATTTLKL